MASVTLSQNLQWQIRRTFHCLSPHDAVGKPKLRVGGLRDGGYVMLDDFATASAVYSLGIGGDVSFDLEMAGHGMSIHQYDHTVPGPPAQHPLFHFQRKGLAAVEAGEFTTIGNEIRRNGHSHRRDLILKIDIECAEWEVLDATSDEDLDRFEQIVAEFHGFLRIREPEWRALTQRVLGRLFRTHAVYHVHANNWADFQIIDGVPVPDVLEVSYVRRDRATLVPSTAFFPTPFDVPCHPDRPDIILGNFRFL
jgi:hypothetical protein